MRNPPIALFLALPFGAINEWLGALVWSLLLVLSLVTSIRLVWKLMGKPPGGLHLAWYMFPPALECLTVGQVGMFLLLGCLHRRASKALAGLATAVVACSLLTEAIDTSAWSQYAQMMRKVDVLNEPLPTVSLLFRVAIDLNAAWLQFVPAAVAALWAVWYFRRQRHWNWTNQGIAGADGLGDGGSLWICNAQSGGATGNFVWTLYAREEVAVAGSLSRRGVACSG
jgi:hypothetical protein